MVESCTPAGSRYDHANPAACPPPPRNELSGPLPGAYDRSTLVALIAGNHRAPGGGAGGGLSGPIPVDLLGLSTLLFLNLANNGHTGRLPALPPNAVLVNVTHNRVSGWGGGAGCTRPTV
jgi:hypothetical protein